MREERKTNLSYILAFIAIAYFAVGLVLIFSTGALTTTVCIIGALLILMGILKIWIYLKNDSHIQMENYDFSFGVLMVILGILLLVQNQAISVWLPHLLAVCVVITSVMKMQNALALKRLKDTGWTLFFIMAAISLILACVILFSKNSFADKNGEVNIYVPVMLIVDGLFDLLNLFRLAGKLKAYNALKNSQEKPVPAQDVPEPLPANVQDPQ